VPRPVIEPCRGVRKHRCGNYECGMGKLTVALIVVVALAVAAGGLFLAFWEIPAPSKPVEKVLPDARFPK
jgi:hypothetical protein